MYKRILVFVIVSICSVPASWAQPLRIGVLLCQTGDCAEWGSAGIQGARLAVEELNAAGGVNGSPVELIVEDSAEDNLGATISAYRTLRARGINYIVGPTWSPAGKVLAPIAKQDKGVVMISPSLGVRDFNEAGENLFNVWPHDEYNARRMANFALQTGLRRIAIFSAQQPWSEMQARVFREEFEQGGGRIVLEETPLPESRDLRIEVTKLSHADADAVLFTCFAEQMGVAAAQLRRIGFTGKQLSVLMYDSAISTSRGALEGAIYASSPAPAQEFQSKFEKHFGVTPGTSADKAYDAVKIISAAAARTDVSQIAKVREFIAATEHFRGASGDVTFTAQRGVVAEPQIFQVQSGRMGLAFSGEGREDGSQSARAQLKRE